MLELYAVVIVATVVLILTLIFTALNRVEGLSVVRVLGALALFVLIHLAILALFYGSFATINKISFPGKVAQIEQLRTDSSDVSVEESEDVIGQVTQWNQTIASYQTYIKIWWADFLIHDGWEEIDLIKIPSR